jgi:3-oxoadipate enol-lactonase
MPLDERMWEPIQPELEHAGFKVVAPALPGPEPVRGMEAWARRVLGLVDGAFVPVGSSMGGYLAFELWRQARERIAALVLAGSRATPDSAEQRAARDASIEVLREQGVAAFWEGMVANLFSPATDEAVVARARSIALEQPAASLVATVETLRDRPDSRPTLAEIDVPVLVLVGEEDAVTPLADAQAMADELSDGRLTRIAGAGHLLPVEQPGEVVDALVPFLRELGP